MDPSDPMVAAFLELYGSLPRHGPGNRASTLAALARVHGLPDTPHILDAGCGSGAATMALAEALPNARIHGIDVLDMLLERLREHAASRGIAARVSAHNTSMLSPGEGPFDLIWSEGAVYNVGPAAAFAAWRPLVPVGGWVVVCDGCWFVPPDQRPAELRAFWDAEHPDLPDEAAYREAIDGVGGWRVQETFRLPRDAWLADYYQPLRAACDAQRATADEPMRSAIAMAEREIDIFERYGDRYGYAWFIARRV